MVIGQIGCCVLVSEPLKRSTTPFCIGGRHHFFETSSLIAAKSTICWAGMPMICSSVKRVRCIVRPQVGSDSHRWWRKQPVAGHRADGRPERGALFRPSRVTTQAARNCGRDDLCAAVLLPRTGHSGTRRHFWYCPSATGTFPTLTCSRHLPSISRWCDLTILWTYDWC